MELALAPIMIPIATGYAMLCHIHRQVSRYMPNVVSMDEANATTFTVLLDDQSNRPRYNVLDGANEVKYVFEGSRLTRGLYNFIRCGPDRNQTPIGNISVGVWSSFRVFKTRVPDSLHELTQIAIGLNNVKHQADALDNYRMTELIDGSVFQWSKRGKVLERVYNLGQKDSEVRDRLATVSLLPANKGYRITIDNSKMSNDIALMTSMISYLDQWNTMFGVGGIYMPVSYGEMPWRRV